MAIGEGALILGLVALLCFRGGEEDAPVVVRTTVGAREIEDAIAPPPALPASPAPARERVAEEVPSSESSSPVADAPRIVHGLVTDPEGNPLRTTVVLRSTADVVTRWYGQVQHDGRYAVAGLPVGPLAVHVTHPGFRPYEESVDVSVTRHDIVLEPALMIDVIVRTPDGRAYRSLSREDLDLPLRPNFAVYVSREPFVQLPLTNLRDAPRTELGEFKAGLYVDGRHIQPEGDAIGFLQMNAGPPFHVALLLRQTLLTSQAVTQPVESLTFVVDPAVIRSSLAQVRLRVVDRATGAPLTNGRVSLNDRQSGGGGERPDENGSVVLQGIVPGLLVLEPYFEGYASTRRYVRVHPGADLDLGTVALDRPAAIRGVVKDEDGAPVDARIAYRDQRVMTSPQPVDVGMSARTDGAGKFEIQAAGRGPQLLFVTPLSTSHARRTVVVDTTGGDVENVEIVLPLGTEVTFERADSSPVLWQLQDEGGNVVLGILATARTAKVFLAPGRYTVRTYDDETVIRSKAFRVEASPLTVEL